VEEERLGRTTFQICLDQCLLMLKLKMEERLMPLREESSRMHASFGLALYMINLSSLACEPLACINFTLTSMFL